ncbi:MAG: hypothetical protein J6Z43_05375 [Clostridiales bacterium]|nr:hypothetical protein [Clostridiales bacterium]
MVSSKKTTILMCVLIVAMSFLRVIFWEFGDMDELWSYNMSRGIAEGFVPYRDFNMVPTPLFAFVNSAILLVSNTLLAYRISCAVILAVFMILVFEAIAERTNVFYAMPVVMLCLMFTYTITYNALFFICAVSIYLLFGREETDKRNFLIGVLAACAALSRQSSGGVLMILVLCILAGKKRWKGVIMYLAGAAVPCLILLGYLLITHSFYEFWDYCFFGLFEFGSDNYGFGIDALPNMLILLAGIVCDLLMWKTERGQVIIHLILGISVMMICVPIVEGSHSYFGAVWFSIPVVAFTEKRFGKYLKKWMSVLMSSVFALGTAALIFVGISGLSIDRDHTILAGTFVDADMVSDFDLIAQKNEEYRQQGHKVTTLSNTAILISVIGGHYDPVFDMFNKGNFGRNDPLDYVGEACASPDAVIVMPDDYPAEGLQNPKGVYEYVTDRCTPVESFGRFTWYVPKEVVLDG